MAHDASPSRAALAATAGAPGGDPAAAGAEGGAATPGGPPPPQRRGERRARSSVLSAGADASRSEIARRAKRRPRSPSRHWHTPPQLHCTGCRVAVVERAALPVRACSQLPRRSSQLSTVRADAPSCALRPCPGSSFWLCGWGAMSTHRHTDPAPYTRPPVTPARSAVFALTWHVGSLSV